MEEELGLQEGGHGAVGVIVWDVSAFVVFQEPYILDGKLKCSFGRCKLQA